MNDQEEEEEEEEEEEKNSEDNQAATTTSQATLGTTQTKPYRYTCPYPPCTRTFHRKINLQSHILVHTGTKQFECSKCSTSFVRKNDLARHMELHKEGSAGRHVCGLCQKGFSRK
ncbi:hypothetical protein HDV05_003949, partial [Chytridiales sp. JEL 0842]